MAPEILGKLELPRWPAFGAQKGMLIADYGFVGTSLAQLAISQHSVFRCHMNLLFNKVWVISR